jgi:hypothetical protein
MVQKPREHWCVLWFHWAVSLSTSSHLTYSKLFALSYSVATLPGSTASFKFSGDGVSLYGAISTQGAPYTIQLDGGPVQSFTTTYDRFVPQSLLYHATNLGEGDHILHIGYQPSSTGQVLAVDYANVYTTKGSTQ